MKQRIGFIGLGKMGSVMAPLFIEAGYQLTVYNRSSEKTQQLKSFGAQVADKPSVVSENSDFIFTMLSDDKAVESIFLSEQGLLSVEVQDKLFIDMSTIQPQTAIMISEKIQKKSAAFIDAPVSGTVAPAAKGELLIFCGGDGEQIERVKPCLEVLARRIIHAGNTGSGSLLKLVVNLPLAIYWQALAEAILLGKSGELSDETMLDAIADSSAALAVLKMKIPIMLGEDMPVAFDMQSMVKDLALMLSAASDSGINIPTTKSSFEVYSEAVKEGSFAKDDAVRIIDYMQNRSSKNS